MPDYSKAQIYKIVVKNNPDALCYVGSTVQTLNDRFLRHKRDASNPNIKKPCATKEMFSIYPPDKCEILPLENYSCNSKSELEERERYWLDTIGRDKCFNKNRPRATDIEKQEKNKEWMEENRDKINEDRKQKVDCECGAKVRKSGFSAHKLTVKHQQWLATQQTQLPKPKLNLKLSLKTDAN